MKRKNQEMILQEKNYRLRDGHVLPLLEFSLYLEQSWMAHAFTTREGGRSEGMFSSLNLSFNRGDQKEHVMENYRRISEAMGFSLSHIVTSDQTHTTHVRLVGEEDAGKGLTRARDYSDVDGLITNTPGLLLATFYADCVPLYFVDPKHRALGLSHSGWRGTVQGMGAVTVQAMQESFGTDPMDLLCAIGPSICRDCYEVGQDVADAFAEKFAGQKETILTPRGQGKYQLDLWEANRRILQMAGVRPEHIAVTNICTCCNADTLFSHRASQGKRGNLGAFLGIRVE